MNILHTLLALNAVDIITGFIKAVDMKDIKSAKMKEGLISKAMQWVIIVLCYLLKDVAPDLLGINIDLTTIAVAYYVVMEAISIIENVSHYLPIPPALTALLSQAKDKVSSETKEVKTTTNPVLGTTSTGISEQDKLMKELKGEKNE